MKKLFSRDGSVGVELMKLSTSFDFIDTPYVIGGNPDGSLRWSNFFNALNADTDVYSGVNGPNATLSFTASQTLTTITATTNVFSYPGTADVGRTVVFDSGAYGIITAVTSATQATVSTSQTVAASTARIMSTFGRTGGGINQWTVLAIVRPSYVTNADSKIPGLAGVRSVKSNDTYYGIYHNATRDSEVLNGFNQYRGYNLSGSLGTDLASSPVALKGNGSSDDWQIVGITQNDTTIETFVNGTCRSASIADAPDLGINCLGFPFANYSAPVSNPDLDYLTSSIGWSMGRFAAMFVFSRVLSQAELLDFYGMVKHGNGYAISRAGLEAWYIGRKDTVIAADRTALQGYLSFNVPRTRIPDLSGKARHARLYTDKSWTDLLGGSNANPGIYIPRIWEDYNFTYDGTNDYTKNVMVVNSVGTPTFS